MKNEFHIYREYPERLFNNKFIESNDAWFYSKVYGQLNMEPVVEKLVSSIDKATVIDRENWTMRCDTGDIASMENLSTGCKTAINAYYFPDYLVNGIEAGSNALSAMLLNLSCGNFLMLYPDRYGPDLAFSVPAFLHVDNKILSVRNYEELYYYLERAYKGEEL